MVSERSTLVGGVTMALPGRTSLSLLGVLDVKQPFCPSASCMAWLDLNSAMRLKLHAMILATFASMQPAFLFCARSNTFEIINHQFCFVFHSEGWLFGHREWKSVTRWTGIGRCVHVFFSRLFGGCDQQAEVAKIWCGMGFCKKALHRV